MSGKVLQIKDLISRQDLAADITDKYIMYSNMMQPFLQEKVELRNYVYATDTRKTANNKLPWKNSTTLPKLCQIRDNLHANYMSALFPNDNWLIWEGDDQESETQAKRQAITYYVKNKFRESGSERIVGDLLYDYIEGNVLGDLEFVRDTKLDPVTGEEITSYVGPRVVRHSIFDQVFNPTATSYQESPKITRYIKSLGELRQELETRPELGYNQDILDHVGKIRTAITQYDVNDVHKATGYAIDGFGSLKEYYESPYVEILEFEGDIHDDFGNLQRDRLITVVDRSHVVRNIPNPSWLKSYKVHCPWRPRPDNLIGMGPLDNLVGMQYRIDHLENAKADAFDLAIHPPLAFKGAVESFEWGPGAEVFLGEDGEIIELGKNLGPILQADAEIEFLERRMEEYAGAPKEAMGIRSPGEKTAFEVQRLENAASRIFQIKIAKFEKEVLEPLVNGFLEMSKRMLDGKDVIRIMDEDFGVAEFLTVTKEDITAKGKLRPIGARHFAAQAQLIQNLNGVMTSPIGQVIAPHMSSKKLARLVEEVLGFERFDLFSDNIGIIEQAETQRLVNQIQEDLAVEQATPSLDVEDSEIAGAEPGMGVI